MRQIILGLAIILCVPTLADAQAIASAVPDEQTNARSFPYGRAFATRRPLADAAALLAVAAVNVQEPRPSKPATKMRSPGLVLAGVATVAAAVALAAYFYSCNDEVSDLCMEGGETITIGGTLIPVTLGIGGGVMIWQGARSVGVPTPSVAFRVRF